MSRQRHISSKTQNHELTVQDHESDSPIIPIAQIERLYQIRPDRVDWVFEQTELEAIARRKESARINTFIFAEHFIGTLCAFLLGMTGMLGTIWLAYEGKEIAASSIGGATLVGLVSTFMYSNRKK